MKKFIKVDLENGKHVCKPTRTEVKPGDSVEWNGGVIVFFPDATPFREGRGPFSPGDPQTVDQIATAQERRHVQVRDPRERDGEANRRGHRRHLRVRALSPRPAEAGPYASRVRSENLNRS